DFQAVSDQISPNESVLYQPVFIPTTATSVLLSWKQRIHNEASDYSDGQFFSVNLYDLGFNQLAQFFVTQPGYPLDETTCSVHVANMLPYRGQTVVIAFIEEATAGYLNAYVDDVRLTVSTDCNGNGIPDECDIATSTSMDCDNDGVPDECERVSSDE